MKKQMTESFNQNRKVLLFEDNLEVQFSLANGLRLKGFEVSVGDCVEDLIVALKVHRADFIVTDLLMPNLDGIEIIKFVRKIDRHIPIVAMSGGGLLQAEEYLEMARGLGASAVLRKPFSIETLVRSFHDLEGSNTVH